MSTADKATITNTNKKFPEKQSKSVKTNRKCTGGFPEGTRVGPLLSLRIQTYVESLIFRTSAVNDSFITAGQKIRFNLRGSARRYFLRNSMFGLILSLILCNRFL